MASTTSSGRREQERDPFLVLEHPNNKVKSSLSAKQFDLFIDLRGPEVKATLARQVYDSLGQAGIRAYLDSEETEPGDFFSASVHIAILSPRFAEPAWCLAELALMFQTRARIITLFHHVPTSVFRYIVNGVADAFSKYEEEDGYPKHEIQQWKECLQNISGIKGYELNRQNDDLNKLCNGAVSAVMKEKQKRKAPLQVAKYEVRLDDLVKNFHNHCQRNGQMRYKMICIFGMGGSGKTTLVKDLFKRKYSGFYGSTILFEVRGKYVIGEVKTSTDLQWLELEHIFYYMCILEWIPLQNLHTLVLRGVSPQKLWQRDDQDINFLVMASTSSSRQREQECNPFLALEPPNNRVKSSLSAKQFDVFINHRGPDVKATLAWQLYDSLGQAGIWAYLDSEETELGDFFPSAIKNAIFSAAVHIAILSPRYAESAWCLAELALIFQTRARIIPLFYNVLPSDFRYIINGVADAFSKHEEKDRYFKHDIQQWKECLQKISGIKGYILNGQNDDLNKLFNGVVSAVMKEKQKRKIPLQVAKYEVGLDELVKDFHGYCERNGQMRDKIIGIFGMGGSGKTTLAKYLFNCKHPEFSGSTSLFEVREKYVKGELTSLQSKLMSDLFCENHHKFCSTEEGTAYIKRDLQRSWESRFLIVIDNLDHKMQLDALVPLDALNSNSLVIVTTRDERLLIQAGVRVRYKMKEMNPEHSRQLFCWHAFHRQSCKRGFENLVDSFVEACGGLSLALQVMGGHIFGSDKGYWKLQLDDVKTKLHRDIKHTLKISYDGLEEDQKQIFMDIACFFVGKKVSTAISIWKASGWRAEHALQVLKDKCLVEVESSFIDLFEHRRILRMHDHLCDLGREMADDATSQPCRLWRPNDLIGMHEIKGFQNVLRGSEFFFFKCFNHIWDNENFQMTYFLEKSKTSTDLQWLELEHIFYYMCIPEWIPLQNLHTSILGGVSPQKLWQRDNQAPLKLKELYCCFGEQLFIAEDVFLRDFNELVSSFKILKHLESLHLKFGRHFSQWSIQWNCLLKSVRELTSLKTLELAFFNIEGEIALRNMGETTDYWFCMKSLEAITLCRVFNTRKVSISGQLCPNLKCLKLYSMADLTEVDLTGLTTLECLELLGCRNLRKLLSNDLPRLEMFRIKFCCTMKELPNFGRVSCLKRIYISRCWNLQNISVIERWKGLKRIWIAYCPELQNIKAIEQLKRLKRIWIEKCPKLQDIMSFKELKELKRIFIADCPKLQNIEGIKFLIHLESIIITKCPKLQNIRGIEELNGLKEMIIADSPIISCIKRLQILPRELTILVGRLAISVINADTIGSILSMMDGCYEMDCCGSLYVKEAIHLFHKTKLSCSTYIFCAMLEGSPRISRDICNGTSCEGLKRYVNLCDHGKWIFLCVVNEEMTSKFDKFVCYGRIMKAFLVVGKKGEERKTLDILQMLSAQLCDSNGDAEDKGDGYPWDFDAEDRASLNPWELSQYYDRDGDAYPGDSDDDDYNGNDDDYNDDIWLHSTFWWLKQA